MTVFVQLRRQVVGWWNDNLLTIVCLLFALFWIGVAVIMILMYSQFLHFRGDVPYIPKPTPTEAPCERKFCSFGAQCHEDQGTGRAECRCLERCNNVFAPVCGTDGVTYSNECQLRVASCAQQTRISVRSQGTCDVKDPCKGKDCSFGAKCVPSLDGLTARCQCPDRCVTYGDSLGSSPVCGSDGRDYGSSCEMERSACSEMKDIAVKYYGKCDPCVGHECPASQVCQLDEQRLPTCRCNGLCTLEFSPVCGSDGRTYSNECIMNVEACKARKDTRILFRGECTSGINPCNNLSCRPGEECHIDREGIAKCTCPPPCEQVLRRVCGSDGRTYDNECELRRQSCLDKRIVTLAMSGDCSMSGPCARHRCRDGALCAVKNGRPTCECPVCTEEFKPVCGSDGYSYTNECKLKEEACIKRKDITKQYNGHCNGCKDKKCDHYAICESDGSGKSRCVCPASCIQVEDKVCGTDGENYQNECELRVASCRKQQFIMIASQGTCDLCANVKCRFGARCENGKCVCPQDCPDMNEPVCASDGQTYTNECEMRKQSCSQGVEIEVIHSGQCDELSGSGDEGSAIEVCDESTCRFGGTCEYDAEGSHGCVCNFNCDAIRSPVCGSDGKTYGNECQMREESCRKQREIIPRPMDNCEDMDEEMCDGNMPLVNPTSGYDYNCMNGRETCPANSYCHRVGGLAKCCKEEQPIRSCLDSHHGCCPDGITPAPGPNNGGCPSVCQCHNLGAYRATCDPRTRQCTCKPGVGGLRCDRCEPGFWGLPKIAEGNSGCTPCGCNLFGSVRDDCEQMTGRCVCRASITGNKCNTCPNGKELGSKGCTDQGRVRSCSQLVCRYGARCRIIGAFAECHCSKECPTNTPPVPVCGTDGNTYGSECQLGLFSCRMQRHIAVSHQGACNDLTVTSTTSAIPAMRSRKTTRHIAGKVTRHIVPPTPATPEYGMIGDFCLGPHDCIVENAFCKNGLCQCAMGFSSSDDNLVCREDTGPTPSTLLDPCTTNPCQNGGKCYPDNERGFRCSCPLGWGGPVCKAEKLFSSTQNDQGNVGGASVGTVLDLTEAEVNQTNDLYFVSGSDIDQSNASIETSFIVPSFAGTSYIQFAQIEANPEVVIELEFRTLNNDGILLYMGQLESGEGDYLSLVIKDGHVEFRFDLGSGALLLKSPETVKLNTLHRVVARRFSQDGSLRIDDAPEIIGTSPGTRSSLNLITPLFIGYVSDPTTALFQNVRTDMGLVGCVESLKVSTKASSTEYDLMFPGSRHIVNAMGISECGQNPCSSLPCQNGGTCMKVRREGFTCKCLPGWTGSQCQRDLSQAPCDPNPCKGGGTCAALPNREFTCRCPPGSMGRECQNVLDEVITVPEFHGNSFLEIKLTSKVGRSFAFELWFMTTEYNGVLLYGSQDGTDQGDYIALLLTDGYLEFRFDLGSGSAVIRSTERILKNTWNRIDIQRTNRLGTMIVNAGRPLRGHSKGILKELNLGESVFLGGFPGSYNQDLGLVAGFKGAIQRIYENGVQIENLVPAAVSVQGLMQYNGRPCPSSLNPCQNGAICIPILDDYECKCTEGFTGLHCDKASGNFKADSPVSFDGYTYHKYLNRITKRVKGQKENKFEVRLRTEAEEGLVLLMHKSSTVQGDYLAMAIRDGYCEISYNLGKQSIEDLHVLRSNVKVNDGLWHTVTFQREKRKGTLDVDGGAPTTDVSVAGATQLDTDGHLWLGGTRHLPSGLPEAYQRGFYGCIDRVFIDNEQLNLVEDRKSHRAVEFCVA